jgi:hypothetical protein
MNASRLFALGLILPAVGLGLMAAPLPTALEAAVRELRAVTVEGQGNVAASGAWKAVAAAPLSSLPSLLEAMDGANDYALNWLRSAVETVEQRGRLAGGTVPVDGLEAFLRETRHHPRARRLAYELIQRAEPQRAARMLPGFVNDPANELRREAVDHVVTAGDSVAATDASGAIAKYREALGHSREADQIDVIAKKLTDLKEKVDLPKVFGWVMKWKLIGPFDNTGGAGFATAYPPESQVALDAVLDGKGAQVRWVDFESKDDYGMIDFNKPFSELKEVAGYAYAELWSEKDQPVEIRLGCQNGWKVWVNGKYLFGRDEYHRNREVDQYRMPVGLKAGKNVILVKCCQNEQKEDWTKSWDFQLRVTDAQGTPVVSAR